MSAWVYWESCTSVFHPNGTHCCLERLVLANKFRTKLAENVAPIKTNHVSIITLLKIVRLEHSITTKPNISFNLTILITSVSTDEVPIITLFLGTVSEFVPALSFLSTIRQGIDLLTEEV
jgi:hypothetical protein